MNDRRQSSDLTGRRINHRRKDAETREKFDLAQNMANAHLRLWDKFQRGAIDVFQYRQQRRWLIEESAGIKTGVEVQTEQYTEATKG